MSFDNPILCEICGGRDFELVSGFHYCQTENCGVESRAHGPDFVYEEINAAFAEPGEFGEDTDSNDENNRRNDYPDEEDLLQNDNEDFVNEEMYPPFTEPRDFGEDPDSNDEEDQMESDNEESSDEEELMNLENLEQSHFTSDMVQSCA